MATTLCMDHHHATGAPERVATDTRRSFRPAPQKWGPLLCDHLSLPPQVHRLPAGPGCSTPAGASTHGAVVGLGGQRVSPACCYPMGGNCPPWPGEAGHRLLQRTPPRGASGLLFGAQGQAGPVGALEGRRHRVLTPAAEKSIFCCPAARATLARAPSGAACQVGGGKLGRGGTHAVRGAGGGVQKLGSRTPVRAPTAPTAC